MVASIDIVLIWIPRNVMDVVGPSTLDGFIEALIYHIMLACYKGC